LFIWWAFYFPFGIVCGFHVEQVSQWLAKYKQAILVSVIVLGFLAIVEPELIYRLTGGEWRFVPFTIGTILYSVAFILWFLAFDEISIPFPKNVNQVGKSSYAIYLLHMQVMEFSARVIRQILPWMLAYQVLLVQPVTFIIGLGVPLLFMAFVARSPARRSYRYLFG
jgi:membrane-bound acyltransferase YfiQ involved in biofilm formation